ncbi:hypothetical protein [Thermovirga lienii]|uniref:hypothetical protein n=1 Tax=Thermovirga lienii TaxID=336261 RepID=UPI002FE2E33F
MLFKKKKQRSNSEELLEALLKDVEGEASKSSVSEVRKIESIDDLADALGLEKRAKGNRNSCDGFDEFDYVEKKEEEYDTEDYEEEYDKGDEVAEEQVLIDKSADEYEEEEEYEEEYDEEEYDEEDNKPSDMTVDELERFLLERENQKKHIEDMEEGPQSLKKMKEPADSTASRTVNKITWEDMKDMDMEKEVSIMDESTEGFCFGFSFPSEEQVAWEIQKGDKKWVVLFDKVKDTFKIIYK